MEEVEQAAPQSGNRQSGRNWGSWKSGEGAGKVRREGGRRCANLRTRPWVKWGEVGPRPSLVRHAQGGCGTVSSHLCRGDSQAVCSVIGRGEGGELWEAWWVTGGGARVEAPGMRELAGLTPPSDPPEVPHLQARAPPPPPTRESILQGEVTQVNVIEERAGALSPGVLPASRIVFSLLTVLSQTRKQES